MCKSWGLDGWLSAQDSLSARTARLVAEAVYDVVGQGGVLPDEDVTMWTARPLAMLQREFA